MAIPATRQEWSRLYDLAARFKQLGCWTWMEDTDMIAVTDPDTGEIGYAAVTGEKGTDIGFIVHIGPRAALYVREANDSSGRRLDQDPQEWALSTHALSLTFVDRAALAREDLRVIRELGVPGIDFGVGETPAWPLFRSHEPGKAPWPPVGGQARFLATALEQLMATAEQLRTSRTPGSKHSESLLRLKTEAAPPATHPDNWPPLLSRAPVGHGRFIEPYAYPDEIKLQQLKRLPMSADIWESDFDYAQVAVGAPGERPIYPRLCLWVNRQSQLIIDVQLVPEADCRELFVTQMLRLIESAGSKPERIEVGSNKALLALKHSARRLGVPLRLNTSLQALAQAKEAISLSL